jgi:uncharacterized protein (TIGR03118 family)
MTTRRWFYLAALLAAHGMSIATARADFFAQTNLASDVPGLAAHTDPNLKNPWGISQSATSPFWVSNQVSGNSTLYNTSGTPQALVVTIPNAGAPPSTGPTGQVFNTTSDFLLGNGQKALFMFANLDGSISGWNGGLGTNAQLAVTTTDASSFTGLALANTGSASFLYAANDGLGRIDAFNGTFGKATLAGNFTDPNLPAGFTPYNIQNINGTLYVTYENQQTGGGVVNAFDLNGNFLHRVAANGAAGPLMSPWGLAIAPAGFGTLGGDLLVGNETDGHISIFNPTTGTFLGQISDVNGNPITNTGLWGLTFGNGGNGGDPHTLYFNAGINGEVDGLFGALTAVPEPGSVVLLGVGGLLVLAARRRFGNPIAA